jgi:hypothetical protein
MRRLLLLLLLLCPVPAWAQATFSQFAVDAAGSPFTGDGIDDLSFGSTVASGARVIVFFGLEATSRTVSSVTDDGGNTYALCGATGTAETNGAWEAWAYCSKTTATMQTVTVTLSAASAAVADFVMFAVTGDDSTANGSLPVAIGTDITGTTHNSGNVTLGGDGLLVGWIIGSSGTYTIDADFTEPSGANQSNSTGGYDDAASGTHGFTTTTVGNEATISFLVGLVDAGGAATCTGGVLLLGAGKC